jgi:hypothetical protein
MRTVVHLRPRAAALLVVGVLTALPAVLGIGPSAAAAAPVSGACPSGLSGLGTASSPCLIGTASQLYGAMAGINADTALEGAATDDYELTANIDATTYASGTAGTATSYGATEDWGGINWFTGTFDGDGHTISNLNYTTDSFASTLPGGDATAGLNLGLFRVLNGATVENLTLQNVRASNTATSNLSVGGVSVWSFDSNVDGVVLTDPTIVDEPGGGGNYLGGLVGLAYANDYADDGKTVSDGGSTSFRNDLVSGGSIADSNRTGGIVGMATGPTTVSDNYVDTSLSNPSHPVAGVGGQANTFYYVIGGLVGEVGTTYTTPGGAEAAGVSMSDNTIAGTIKGSATDHRSYDGANFASATVGYATTAEYVAGGSSSPTASDWTTADNLISSTIQYTNETGSGLPGADGTSVSPATLEAESTYAGTATGLTDSETGAIYDELGWSFGHDEPSATSGWGWTGTSTDGSPVPVVAPTITTASNPVAFLEGPAASPSTVLADAGATTNYGALSIDTSSVEWSTPGTYTATVTATNYGFASSEPLTILIVSETVPVANGTAGLEASSTPPSTAELLKALGAALPQGDGGTLGVEYPDGEPDWDTPGSYTVEVTDTGGADGLQPATASIVVVAQPTVALANSAVSFRFSTTVTAQDVLDAAEPTAAYSPGDSGTVTADVSKVGSAVGEYTATIAATDKYGFASAPATVTVAITEDRILLGDSTPVFQATSAEPSEQTILNALEPVLPSGTTGTATVDGYTASDFQTPGEYQATVSDSDTSEGVEPTTATIEVVAVSVVTDANPTVYFNTSVPPTGAEVIGAAGAEVTDGSGQPVPGSSLSASLPEGCGTTAGSCTARITGTDGYGFTTAPVTVTVEVSSAAVAVANPTAVFTDTGSAPSQAALISALGATVTDSTIGGQPVVDVSGVDWSVPGAYAVNVTDSKADDAAEAVSASIDVIPVPVVALPATTVYLPVNADDPLPAATLLANSGATLTDGEGNVLAGELSADTSAVNASVAGTYAATIAGTDEYGFESATVTVTVVMYLSSQQAGAVAITGADAVGGTLTANLSGWEGLAPPEYQWLRNGQPIPGATSASYTVTVADGGQGLSVEVVEAPKWYERASAASAVVTIEGPSQEERQKAEEAKHAAEVKEAEEAGHAAEVKAAEEAGHAAEVKAAEEAGHAAEVKEAEEAEHAPEAGNQSSGGGNAAKPKLEDVKLAAGMIRVSVKVAEKGTLIVTATSGATKLGSTTEKVKKAGTVSVKLALSRTAKAKLARHSLKVTLKLRFKTAAGKTTTLTRTVTLGRSST